MGNPTPVLVEMEEQECRALLAAHHFGRLAVVVDGGRVTIFPVNYVFDGQRVAIRTDPGTKLAAADLSHVAFEIDEVDGESRTGWSVVVQGPAFDVTESIDEVSDLVRDLPVEPWAPGAKAHWLRIEGRTITGRRLL